jgi:hypothetical protein
VPLKRSLAHKDMPTTARREKWVVSGDELTAILAERIMRWGVCPERFLLEGRSWLPRWRFQPADRLTDAFKLLEKAAPERCDMRQTPDGFFVVKLQIGSGRGQACEKSKPRAITYAVARTLGLKVGQ